MYFIERNSIRRNNFNSVFVLKKRVQREIELHSFECNEDKNKFCYMNINVAYFAKQLHPERSLCLFHVAATDTSITLCRFV